MADAAMVAEVRRFNRTVTLRAGALNQRFLDRKLSLGEARVLWEIGIGGCAVRTLRARLQLDSGYLSRVLRTLESAELIQVVPDPHDRRIRVARLTRKGRTERRTIDRRSDEVAAAILEPLDAASRERLVKAMRDVERLLTASEVEIGPADPTSEAARYCIESYFTELYERSDGRFDRYAAISAEPHELVGDRGCLLLATLHGEPIGCGAVKYHGREPAELKRMWVAGSARGLGVGRRMLAELERLAREHGATVAHIETSNLLTEAIALYRSAGWVEVDRFNDEPFADHWFEKRLTPRRRSPAA
jgi:DNA-binding MarR family transcriptional regulator/GNAT superfamily N-acetyltransferase